PKGAIITNRSQTASGRAQIEHMRATSDDLLLTVNPFNHVGGITCAILSSLIARMTCVIIPAFDFNDIINRWKTYNPTVFGGVPTLFALMLMNEEFKALDKSAIRIIVTGGSNCDPPLLAAMKDAFPNAFIMNLYGLSESSGAVVLSPWESDFDTTVRSIGKPIDDFEVKVIDLEGNDLPMGETGELCFRGDAVGGGYFRMPEETAETFDSDDWLHTGDMGYLDENGYIFLMGRKKEMYLQGGFNVYPVEVENILATHPKVLMAAGIGIPDPVMGEVGRYYVIPRPGTEPTEDELKAYCREHLADYKTPRQIVFRTELPMTPLGKIMKSVLREEYEQE
ncbi:MAG: AMP-binding protein, partial [Desulfomonilia bacterium]|nr:AMP-binding protein [Desulfomonilia bacterium]